MLIPIVTYHYVRPNSERFSENHKSLDIEIFVRQLEFLNKQYSFVYGPQIRDLVSSSALDKKNPVWLCFDDGYLDHYKYVFPELMSRSAVGSFFVPTEAIFERKLLDVNKVHLVLAENTNVLVLIEHIRELFDANFGEKILKNSFNEIRRENSVGNLMNDPDTRFVKLFLQELLPPNLRKIILDNLFRIYVNRNESAVVDELYMNPDQIKLMYEAGMNIGSHGHAHSRLEFMSRESQLIDIELSINYLRSVGIDNGNLVVCYPYGSFNHETKSILSDHGCIAAITAKLGTADTNDHNFDWLEIERIDTKFFNQFFNLEN